jgi:hypothetical protein
MEGIEHGTGPRFHLLLEVSRQETVLLVHTHGGPGQYDTLNLARHERLGSGMTRQERLPRTRRTCSDNDRNRRVQEVKVPPLIERARTQHLL